MSRGVFFGGAQALDDDLVRGSVMRIPEVLVRLREAQGILDRQGASLDLCSIMAADNRDFQNFLKYRGLLSFVVQVGLFDRYRKTQPLPAAFIGQANGEMAARFTSGQKTFAEVVELSMIETKEAVAIPGALVGMPMLARGVTNSRIHVLIKGANSEYMDDGQEHYQVEPTLDKLIENQNLSQLILIGPGMISLVGTSEAFLRERLEVLESIDLDPLLGWFWTDIRRMSTATA
jgi:hypothetical protein